MILMMSKLILIACLGLTLSACNAPTTPTTTDNDTSASTDANASTDVSTDTSVDVSTDASLAIEPKNLSRTQFLSAMTCAEAKADAGQKSIFIGQKSAFSDPGTEASFNTVMGLGGGGQYVIYKEAVAIGCTGR
jgi:hypothetical protein